MRRLSWPSSWRNRADLHPMSFETEGYTVLHNLLGQQEVQLAQVLTQSLVERYRAGDVAVVADGVSIASATSRHPDRNPGVIADSWDSEPFILGNPVAHEPRFSLIFTNARLWASAADLLKSGIPEIVLHMSNITRKPAGIGPAIGWHRDRTNTYFAVADGKMVRLLLPLQEMSQSNGGTAIFPRSHGANSTSAADMDKSAVACPLVRAGDALALHSSVLHGGVPNRSALDRDVIVLQFGVRSSELLYSADEALALCGLEEVIEFASKHCGPDVSTVLY